jgi:hypothetical protein
LKLALAILLLPMIAHATLGIVTAQDLLKRASKVAIVIGDGRGKARVATAYRGMHENDVIDVVADLPAAAALYICDGDDCATGVDRGGYYILHLPGRKGPILVEPGLFESTAIAGLARGEGAKPLCIHATLALTDEPLADSIAIGKFAAEDGKGTLTIDRKAYPGQLTVGGVTHSQVTSATIRLDSGMSFVGGPLVRESGGCYAFPIQPVPLARTPRLLAQVLAGQSTIFPIAHGKGISIANDATVTASDFDGSNVGQMIATDHGVSFIYYASDTGQVWNVMTIRQPLWFPEVPPAAQLAHIFADGKPHEIELGRVRGAIAPNLVPTLSRKAMLSRVADPR